MTYYTIASLERRGGFAFQLKDLSGRITIGTMKFNSAKVRHELELSEPDFLRHAKTLAQICRLPGAAVFVASIRHEEPVEQPNDLPHEASGVEVFANTPFFKLRGIAKAEGVNIAGLKGNRALAEAINAKRLQPA